MKETTGNLEQVRAALHGITGQQIAPPVTAAPDRYLVMARTNHELDAVDSFRRNCVSAYWPSYEELAVSRERRNGFATRRWRRVGIIPGYIFAAIDPDLDFTTLLHRVVGALDMVRTLSGDPLLIRDADIQIIRRIEIGLNTPLPQIALHNFKPGEKVRFVDDLVGRWPPGIITKLAREGRISVEVALMGRKVKITVLPHQIERT